MTPIFIFSLPRSGSTLLQRILGSHSDISTIAETWLMLPFVGASKDNFSLSVYSSSNSYLAISEFIQNLPNKENDYYSALSDLMTTLYDKQNKTKTTYFIDKTPRYYYIIPEISKMFPKAKFIFLFRNPIQIYASVLSTWGKDNFGHMYSSYNDLNVGLGMLSYGRRLLHNRSVAVNYEDIIFHPEKHLSELCKYLDIKFEQDILISFYKNNIFGAMGDQVGIKEYDSINHKPLHKWKHIFNTNFRKKILHNYINQISDKDIITLGYNKDVLLKDIHELASDGNYSLIKDVLDLFKTKLLLKFHLHFFFSKNKSWMNNKFID